jgi:hypothetical protein
VLTRTVTPGGVHGGGAVARIRHPRIKRVRTRDLLSDQDAIAACELCGPAEMSRPGDDGRMRRGCVLTVQPDDE